MGEVYREHFGFVWTLLRRLGVAERDLEDVAHDVFVVVHRRLPQFERRSAVRTWIYAIAVRVAANYRRKRRDEPDPDGGHARSLVAPASTDPEAHALRSQAAALLDRLLARMDDKKRTVFVLAEIEGLKAPEIARIVGTNPRTVHSRLRAARTRFESDLARVRRSDEAAGLGSAQWVRDVATPARPPAGADERVWAALVVSVPGLATQGSVAAASIGGATGWLPTLKAVGLSVALGGATLGVVVVATAPLRDSAAGATAPAAAPSTAAAKRIAPAGSGAALRGHDAHLAGPHGEPGDGHVASKQAEAASGARADAVTPARGAGPTDTTLGATPPKPATADAASPASQTRQDDAADSPEPGPATEGAPADAFVRDVALLDEVRHALAQGDPATALARADAHALRFPDSRLRRERERTRVAALCALHRPDDAEAAARRAGVPVGCTAPDRDAGT